MKKNTKIKVEDICKSFGDHKVLDGINLDVKEQESLVILGGSGSGKSVLIKNIIGLMSPDSGKIIIDGKDTTFLSKKLRFDFMKKCGFLFQGGALFDSLNITQNITFYASKLHNLNKKQAEELAAAKLKLVGLDPRILNLSPSELSGGMQKRVSLARAICTDPEIIFFDEPTTGLDPIMANVINELIIKVREELGATTITITHDMASAHMIATHIGMLYQGKILWTGTRDEMGKANNPYLEQFINGKTEGPISV